MRDRDLPDSFTGRAILVTGGTGSFSRKFTDTALREHPVDRVVVYSRDELKQEEMRTNLGFTDPRRRWLIGDVRDERRLACAKRRIENIGIRPGEDLHEVFVSRSFPQLPGRLA